DRLRGVFLVGTDHAGRAALDPAGAVDARRHAPALVRNRPARCVEAHSRQLDAVIADAAEDEAARKRLALLRRHRTVVRVKLVANELDSLDALVAEDRHR